MYFFYFLISERFFEVAFYFQFQIRIRILGIFLMLELGKKF